MTLTSKKITRYVAVILGALVLGLLPLGMAAQAQIATDFYGQAQLLPPDVQPPAPEYQGPHGTASFSQTADGGSNISIDVMDVGPGMTFAPVIREGSCSGRVLYTLPSFTSGADGNGTGQAHIPDLVHTNTSYLTIGATGEKPGAYTMCGQIHVVMTAGGGVGGTGQTPGMPSTGAGDDDALGLAALVVMASIVLVSAGLILSRAENHSIRVRK